MAEGWRQGCLASKMDLELTWGWLSERGGRGGTNGGGGLEWGGWGV